MERYGLKLSWGDLQKLNQLCAEGLGYLRREGDVEHHILIYKDRVLAVVCKVDGQVLTILPMESVNAKIFRQHEVWKKARKREGRYRSRRSRLG